MVEEFDILTAKVLSGEASAQEQARLRQILSREPALESQFNELKATWNSIRKVGPLVDLMGASSQSIPVERLAHLQSVVRDRRETIETVAGKGTTSKSSVLDRMKVLWRRTGLSAMSAVGAGLLLVLVVASALFLQQQARQSSRTATNSQEIVAHLLVMEGRPEVKRNGQRIRTDIATPLQGTDQVVLPLETKTYLVTATGSIELKGPRKFIAADESGRLAIENGRKGRLESVNTSNALHLALFQGVQGFTAPDLLVATRGAQSIPLYSPLGATANPKPVIIWKTEPGTTYDVTISDEFDSKALPLSLSGVVPPVDLANVQAWPQRELTNGGLYRVNLRQTGKPFSASEYTFQVLKEPDRSVLPTPAERLIHAYRILSNEPARVGDALAELLTLPPGLANSELVLRLKLYAFGLAGYREDYEAIVAQLRVRN